MRSGDNTGAAARDVPGRADRVWYTRPAPCHHQAHGGLAMAFVTYLVTDVLALAIVIAVAALFLLV